MRGIKARTRRTCHADEDSEVCIQIASKIKREMDTLLEREQYQLYY
jgi:hypothetical protein